MVFSALVRSMSRKREKVPVREILVLMKQEEEQEAMANSIEGEEGNQMNEDASVKSKESWNTAVTDPYDGIKWSKSHPPIMKDDVSVDFPDDGDLQNQGMACCGAL